MRTGTMHKWQSNSKQGTNFPHACPCTTYTAILHMLQEGGQTQLDLVHQPI